MLKSDLCIPKININIKKKYIMEKIEKANIGAITRMTELPLKQNPLYKRILFTMIWNQENQKVANLVMRVESNQNLKLVPVKSEPCYWIITKSCCPGKSII